jgi:hypothetical protein
MFQDPDAAPARNQLPVTSIAMLLALAVVVAAVASIAYGLRAGRLATPAAQATPAVAATPLGR